MKNLLLLSLCFIVIGNLTHLEARIWTSKDGKKIDAEFISLEGTMVSLKMRGKIYKLPLEKLSAEDQAFAAEQQASDKETEEEKNNLEPSLKGVKLIAGKRVDIEFDLNEDTIKALSGNALKPTKCKLAIVFPENFSPRKPQKVFWVVGGINNETERLSGNRGRVSAMSAEAHKR